MMMMIKKKMKEGRTSKRGETEKEETKVQSCTTRMPFCATFKQKAFIKKRTHTERMKKRLSVRNEKQREEEKENEREKEK